MKGRRRLAMDPPELNLVPLLDMVSLLIQLLLINAQFGVFAEVAAALGAPSEQPPSGLQLVVRVQPRGLVVEHQATEGRVERVELPCEPRCDAESYDIAPLSAIAAELDQQHPTEQQVQLHLDPDVPFEVVARVMDGLRGPTGDAFPDVVLAGP